MEGFGEDSECFQSSEEMLETQVYGEGGGGEGGGTILK